MGDNYTRYFEEWNASHDGILDIVYYEEGVTTVLQNIVNDRIDAALAKLKSNGSLTRLSAEWFGTDSRCIKVSFALTLCGDRFLV